jgi:acid phosphatase family membrane protein YuiD
MFQTAALSVLLAWLTTRVWKLSTDYSKEKKLSWKMLFNDGGMPSSHTGLSVGLATTMYFETGLSYYFLISLVLAVIVMRDAYKVRYLVGQHSKILNQLLGKDKKKYTLDERAGHTPWEVFWGAVVGIGVPWLLYTFLF